MVYFVHLKVSYKLFLQNKIGTNSYNSLWTVYNIIHNTLHLLKKLAVAFITLISFFFSVKEYFDFLFFTLSLVFPPNPASSAFFFLLNCIVNNVDAAAYCQLARDRLASLAKHCCSCCCCCCCCKYCHVVLARTDDLSIDSETG